jgi:hypothetical protein
MKFEPFHVPPNHNPRILLKGSPHELRFLIAFCVQLNDAQPDLRRHSFLADRRRRAVG